MTTAVDKRGQEKQYCTLLTNLKVIRNGSTLQLCRLRRSGTFRPWAILNFVYYERMVLFYSTFVAMKRQDSRPVEHDALLDEFELEKSGTKLGEELLYASTIRDGQMLHTLRLWEDRSSNVVRLEATASRGPMEHVPLWTAFVTRFVAKGDVDWAQYDGHGVVSLAAMRPPPYVFLSEYEPPKNRDGLYILQFTSSNGMSPAWLLLELITLTTSRRRILCRAVDCTLPVIMNEVLASQ